MNGETSLISIIIPTYNRAYIIRETLDSIIAQTYKNWECIIVDDGSTDGTEELIEEYIKRDNRFKYFERPKDSVKGANTCRNFGFKKSKGKYIIFLDSDDLLKKDCIENRFSFFETNPNNDFLVFKMGIYNGTRFSNNKIKIEENTSLALLKRFIRHKYPWNITSPIWKKSFLISNNLRFDEKLYRYQDVDFHTRVLLYKNIKFKLFDKTDCYYRIEEKSINKFNQTKFKFNVAKSFDVFMNNLLLNTNSEKYLLLQDDIKFGYYKFIIKFINKKNEIIIKKSQKIIFSKIKVTVKEKIYFFLLRKILLHYKYSSGYYKLSKPIKTYFESL